MDLRPDEFGCQNEAIRSIRLDSARFDPVQCAESNKYVVLLRVLE